MTMTPPRSLDGQKETRLEKASRVARARTGRRSRHPSRPGPKRDCRDWRSRQCRKRKLVNRDSLFCYPRMRTISRPHAQPANSTTAEVITAKMPSQRETPRRWNTANPQVFRNMFSVECSMSSAIILLIGLYEAFSFQPRRGGGGWHSHNPSKSYFGGLVELCQRAWSRLRRSAANLRASSRL